MICMNMSLINWYSMKQSAIETSVFSAKFVAMKGGVKTWLAIRYKLRMTGIPKSWASYIYGDNMLVVHNTSKQESTLQKKCNAIAYYVIHKSVAMGEALTGHIRSKENPADHEPR